jgi:putative intracellular protease/amidase
MKAQDFDTVFCVGAHGPMWDIVDNPEVLRLLSA